MACEEEEEEEFDSGCMKLCLFLSVRLLTEEEMEGL